MAELLLELFSEEIPARMQDRARQDLAESLRGFLQRTHLSEESVVDAYATPRRICAVARDIKRTAPSVGTVRRGPRVDAPEKAVEGFMKSLRGDKVIVTKEEHGGRSYYIARTQTEIKASIELIRDALPQIVTNLPWPKSMRWGDGEFRWVRPLKSILCLFDGEVVRFGVGGIEAGDTTRGHRFMVPELFAVRGFTDYVARLREAKVILDSAERRAVIARGAGELAAAEGLAIEDDPVLLDELKGLIEWPVPLKGAIDASFMGLPTEVLVATMRTNQKYLALRTANGALAPRFVTVANLAASDGGAAIVAGNERVLRARLWDARFFWDQDRQTALVDHLPALRSMVFHARLGNLSEKVARLQWNAERLAKHVDGADVDLCIRAAELAKADLKSGLVGEFPELQGIIGGYCAREQGEPAEVVSAIAEHYLPKGPNDSCPKLPTSVVVALADKFDNLAGFFAAELAPTGSSDAFALRRAGLGVIRIILENKLSLPLRTLLRHALNGTGYRERFDDARRAATVDDLLAFFADRLKVHLRERGVRHDLIAAAFAVGGEDDLRRLIARAEALQGLVDSEDGRNLLTAYQRASGIVAIEEKKDGRAYAGAPSPEALAEPAEHALHAALAVARPRIDAALAAEDYTGAMAALAALRRPVDAFFDGVLVNSPEPHLRENRLLLLNQIRAGLRQVADFSLVEDVARRAA